MRCRVAQLIAGDLNGAKPNEIVKLLFMLLILAQPIYAKSIEKKDIQLDATKITEGTIEVPLRHLFSYF